MEPLKAVIVVAGGTGQRFGGQLPKQFFLWKEKMILDHTLENVFLHNPEAVIFLVLSQAGKLYWLENTKIASEKIIFVESGKERYFSVKNAVQKLTSSITKVAIIDGVRPWISENLWKKGWEIIDKKPSAIPVLPLTEALIGIKEKIKSLDRKNYVSAQTPQFFQKDPLRMAFSKIDYHAGIYDDASVLDAAGFELTLFEGEKNNKKITFLQDIE